MADLPIVCTLSPEALEARRQTLLDALVRRARARHELAEGFRLEFAAADGVLDEIAAAVDAERRCCRFLQFTIAVAPAGGPITLDLAGPPGTREFLAALLGTA